MRSCLLGRAGRHQPRQSRRGGLRGLRRGTDSCGSPSRTSMGDGSGLQSAILIRDARTGANGRKRDGGNLIQVNPPLYFGRPIDLPPSSRKMTLASSGEAISSRQCPCAVSTCVGQQLVLTARTWGWLYSTARTRGLHIFPRSGWLDLANAVDRGTGRKGIVGALFPIGRRTIRCFSDLSALDSGRASQRIAYEAS